MRVAAIDIGSYSVRMTLAEVENGNIRILKEFGRITSLASSLKETGRLRKDRIEETLRVLEDYLREAKKFGSDKIVAVGTEAIRKAENSADFLSEVKRIGLEVEVITPEEEGRISFLAVAYSLRPRGFFLVVDQGGGSTEFVFGRGKDPEEVASLPLGIVGLTERFLRTDPPKDQELEDMRSYIRETIKPLRKEVDEIVGLGGTITTLVALQKGVYPYDPAKVHGEVLRYEDVLYWLETLRSIPAKERSKRFPQVEDRRAEVILSGIVMFLEILDLFKKDSLRVSDWGLKHGLIVRIILNQR